MPTVRELRKIAKSRKLKGYSKMTKPQLLSQLGMKDELKQHKLSTGKSKAVEAQSKNIAKGDATKRAQIKGRLTRAIARDLKAAKASGKELTQEEKRQIALKAVARESKNIRDGRKEDRPKRGGSAADRIVHQLKSGKPFRYTGLDGNDYEATYHRGDNTGVAYLSIGRPGDQRPRRQPMMSDRDLAQFAMDLSNPKLNRIAQQAKSKSKFQPPEGMSVAEYRQQLRRKYGSQSGSRIENLMRQEEKRSQIASGDFGVRSLTSPSRVRELEQSGKVGYAREEKRKKTDDATPMQRRIAEGERVRELQIELAQKQLARPDLDSKTRKQLTELIEINQGIKNGYSVRPISDGRSYVMYFGEERLGHTASKTPKGVMKAWNQFEAELERATEEKERSRQPKSSKPATSKPSNPRGNSTFRSHGIYGKGEYVRGRSID